MSYKFNIAIVASLLAANTAMAGGPVIIAEEPAPIVAEAGGSSSGLLLPLLGLGIVVALVASGSDPTAPTGDDGDGGVDPAPGTTN